VEPSSSKQQSDKQQQLFFPIFVFYLFWKFELVVSSLTMIYSYMWELLQKIDWNNFLPSNPYQEFYKNRQNLLK
jgi:hypothetical protein